LAKAQKNANKLLGGMELKLAAKATSALCRWAMAFAGMAMPTGPT
jgi:hypothetical protein